MWWLVGGLALWYLPVGISLIQIMKNGFSVSEFQVLTSYEGMIEVGMQIKITNTLPVNVTLTRLEMQVIFNGVHVSDADVRNAIIPANKSIEIPVIIRLKPSIIGSQLWQMILENNFAGSVFQFKGKANSKGRPYPFAVNYTVTELLTDILG